MILCSPDQSPSSMSTGIVGNAITRDYGTTGSIGDQLNQVPSLVDDNSTILANYSYLGLRTFAEQDSPDADLRYTLVSPTLSNDPDTGDINAGLDRFGRVKGVRWRDVSEGTDLSRVEYGYDRASNRTWRENPSDPNRQHDWLYEHDGLHRLESAQRGSAQRRPHVDHVTRFSTMLDARPNR